MKHRFLILFLLLSYLGVSQTQIPLAGFKATLNTFPTISGDTMTATFTLLDVSNQFNGISLKTRDSLVIWKNCKRYRIDTVLQAFATQVTVKLLKGGNPSLTPGICALVEETKTNKSFAPFSITDGERQCIQSYYVGKDTIAPKVYVDSIFINDSLFYVIDGDTINAGYVNTTPLKVKDTPTMKLRIVSDTLRADIKKRLNAGTVGGINTWVSIQYDSTGQITNVATALNDDLDKDPTNELPIINFVFDELDLPSTPCKTGDFAYDGLRKWWVCETDAPSWLELVEQPAIAITLNNLAGDSLYNWLVDVGYNSSLLGIKVDNTLKLSNQTIIGTPTAVIKVDTSVIGTIVNIKNLISDSLATIVSPRDSTTVLGGTGITAWESPANTWNIQNDDPDQTVTLTPSGIISISGAYPNFTIGATEVDGDPNNEKQTLSQSFTGTTQATATLSLSGGNYVDTTGFMRLETMFSTAGSRTYRYKSNLGAIMGITEDPTLSGNSNIEVLRTGNQLTWGLRKDNASNGQFYKYNGTAWALATAPTGTVTSVGLGLGTSGTDANVSGSPITGSGSFTLNLPTASATNRGLLSTSDWTTFNNKVSGTGTTNKLAIFNGTSSLNSDSKLGWNAGSSYLDLDGTIRVPNTNTGYILSKFNNVGSEINVLGIQSDNRVTVGSSKGIGVTNSIYMTQAAPEPYPTFYSSNNIFQYQGAVYQNLQSGQSQINSITANGSNPFEINFSGSVIEWAVPGLRKLFSMKYDGTGVGINTNTPSEILELKSSAGTNFGRKNLRLGGVTNMFETSYSASGYGGIGRNIAATGTNDNYQYIATNFGAQAIFFEDTNIGFDVQSGGGTAAAAYTRSPDFQIFASKIRAASLDTDISPPSTSGTLKLTVTDGNGDFSNVGLTNLSFSGGNLVGAAPLSGTLNAIPYFNTTSTLSSMPITYSTALPAMVVPTGNAIHLVGTATIIDKANSYGGQGKFLSKPGDGSGGVLWDNPTFTIRNGSGGSSAGFAILPGNIFDIQAGTNITVTPDFTNSANPKLSISGTGTNLGISPKSGLDITVSSSTGNDVIIRDGFGITNTTATGAIVNTLASPYTLMGASSISQALTTNYAKLAIGGASAYNGDGLNVTFDNTNDEFDILATGDYYMSYKCNCKSTNASVAVIFDLVDNVTSGSLGAISSHYFNNTNEFCHNNSEWINLMTAGSRFSLYAKTASGTTTITDCNIRVFAERVK